MAAGVYDIMCEQGATFRKTFTWLDENEQPINLTGCSARMQVRSAYKSTSTWLSLTSGSGGGLTLEALTGTITMVITATTSAALPINKGVYDLEVVQTNGEVTRLLQGSFIVSPEVTR